MVGYGGFLALAKDVVGVTLEMSCMAGIVLPVVPEREGGVMPLLFQGVTRHSPYHWGCVLDFGFSRCWL